MSNRNFRVLHFVPGDGRNPIVEEISKSLLVPIEILTLYSVDKTLPEFSARNGIAPFSLSAEGKGSLVKVFRFLRFISKNRPNIIFAHSFYPSAISIFARLLPFRVKVVPVRHHNQVHHIINNKRAVLVDKLISKLAFHTIAVSSSVQETIEKEGCNSSKITVIPNGLRIDTGHNIVAQPLPGLTKCKIIAVGRIDWQKNYETMLDIASRLVQRNFEFELNICGDGDEQYFNHLRDRHQSLELEGKVNWLGKRSDVPELLQGSDIFVHTAWDEACPLALIEALIVGIPVVSTSLGGALDVISGFYEGIDPNNPEGFVDEILRISSQIGEFKQLSKSFSNLAKFKFDPIRMRERYESFALEILIMR